LVRGEFNLDYIIREALRIKKWYHELTTTFAGFARVKFKIRYATRCSLETYNDSWIGNLVDYIEFGGAGEQMYESPGHVSHELITREVEDGFTGEVRIIVSHGTPENE